MGFPLTSLHIVQSLAHNLDFILCFWLLAKCTGHFLELHLPPAVVCRKTTLSSSVLTKKTQAQLPGLSSWNCDQNGPNTHQHVAEFLLSCLLLWHNLIICKVRR